MVIVCWKWEDRLGFPAKDIDPPTWTQTSGKRQGMILQSSPPTFFFPDCVLCCVGEYWHLLSWTAHIHDRMRVKLEWKPPQRLLWQRMLFTPLNSLFRELLTGACSMKIKKVIITMLQMQQEMRQRTAGTGCQGFNGALCHSQSHLLGISVCLVIYHQLCLYWDSGAVPEI